MTRPFNEPDQIIDELPCDICHFIECVCPECEVCGFAGVPTCINAHMPLHKWKLESQQRGDRLEAMIDRMAGTNVDLRGFLLESNEVLRSAYSIAARYGKETNWHAFLKRVEDLLERLHKELHKGDVNTKKS